MDLSDLHDDRSKKGTTVNKIAPYWKAVVGFVAPGAVLIGASVLDGSPGNSTITTGEWVTALVACVVTSAGVYAKSNTPAANVDGRHEA